MNMNKKMILFCAVSLIAICVFLTDRGTTSKEHEKPAQIAEEASSPNVLTGAAVISSVSQTAVEAYEKEQPEGQLSEGQLPERQQPEGLEKDDPDRSKDNGVSGTKTPAVQANTSSGAKKSDEQPRQSKSPVTSKTKKKPGSTGRKEGSHAGVQTEKPARQTAPAAAPSKSPLRPAATAEAKNQCALQITCASVLSHMDQLKENLKKIIPPDGVILEGTYDFSEGDTVFDLLKRVCSEQNIRIDYVFTPGFSTYYIKGINQLYEFDCGDESGWMYSVNGKEPDVGCSQYKVKKNDNIVFFYTCER